MEARARKIQTVIQDDGLIRFPGVKTGEHVEVIVIKQDESTVRERPKMYGWLKGRVRIGEDFDDPVPGVDDYQ